VLATELDRVVDQIREHLFKPPRVCIDHHFRVYFILQRDTLRRGFCVQRSTNILHQLVQLNRRRAQLHIPTFNRSELENVVNQLMHARSILANDREKALATLSIFQRARLECFDKRDDRREGRSQFM
jgi:hypothetical protein